MLVYDAIFFDVDDTLLSFSRCSRQAFADTFAALEIPLEESAYACFLEIDRCLWARQKQGEITVRQVLDRRFGQLAERLGIEPAGDMQAIFQEKLAQTHQTEPGAWEILAYAGKICPLYAASNGIYDMQVQRLRLAGLEPYFQDIFVSDALGAEKPQREFFEQCLRKSGKRRENILWIGDSLEADIAGAAAVGLDTCWYNPRGLPAPDAPFPQYIVRKLEECRKLI